jgi:hypothetical protein
MKASLFAGAAMLLAVGALVPVARADGPRASSENHWPGMSDPTANQLAAAQGAAVAVAPTPAPQPHYVWQEGYDRGGKWHGHWVLAR